MVPWFAKPVLKRVLASHWFGMVQICTMVFWGIQKLERGRMRGRKVERKIEGGEEKGEGGRGAL